MSVFGVRDILFKNPIAATVSKQISDRLMISIKRSQDRPKSAVFFMTHENRRHYRGRYFRLVREAGDLCDVYYGYDRAVHGGLPLSFLFRRSAAFGFHSPSLAKELGYDLKPEESVISQGVHFPLVRFALQHSYDYYYLVEYDVSYQGNWADFLSRLETSTADFLTSSIVPYRESNAAWPWWAGLQGPVGDLPSEEMFRSFNPFFRISRRALHYLHESQQAGWRGQCEALLATLFKRAGFDVRDLREVLSSSGEICPKFRRYYRYKPPLQDWELSDSRSGDLLHPVK